VLTAARAWPGQFCTTFGRRLCNAISLGGEQRSYDCVNSPAVVIISLVSMGGVVLAHAVCATILRQARQCGYQTPEENAS
jgi:hypothetical protein